MMWLIGTQKRSGKTHFLIVSFLLVSIFFNLGCAHHKIPVILDHPPKDTPYEVIGPVKTEVNWHSLQWTWFWWHYLPWYPSVFKIHDKALIKKAQALDADAIINEEYLPHRSGARGEAIRFKHAFAE